MVPTEPDYLVPIGQAAIAAEEGFDLLRKPIQWVTTPPVHIPYAAVLENPLYPNKASIVAAVKRVV
jgi:acetoin:2,6-dichlorophenolindophenol oxidoreductase subunit beta